MGFGVWISRTNQCFRHLNRVAGSIFKTMRRWHWLHRENRPHFTPTYSSATLLTKQRAEGNWHGIGASRAPIQDGDLSRTALSIRTLTAFGIPARKTEIDERVGRAATWLSAQTPISTEDRVMQLLGLKWANTESGCSRDPEEGIDSPAEIRWRLVADAVPASDAYATGQVLYALREIGVPKRMMPCAKAWNSSSRPNGTTAPGTSPPAP